MPFRHADAARLSGPHYLDVSHEVALHQLVADAPPRARQLRQLPVRREVVPVDLRARVPAEDGGDGKEEFTPADGGRREVSVSWDRCELVFVVLI